MPCRRQVQQHRGACLVPCNLIKHCSFAQGPSSLAQHASSTPGVEAGWQRGAVAVAPACQALQPASWSSHAVQWLLSGKQPAGGTRWHLPDSSGPHRTCQWHKLHMHIARTCRALQSRDGGRKLALARKLAR